MPVQRAATAVLLGLLLTTAATAQVWRGTGRASGLVLDLEDHPIPGARILLRPADGGTGPAPAHADAAGRWAILGLAPGRWVVAVQAAGFIEGRGWVDVPREGPGKRVSIRLRRLDETTPAFSEGSPRTIQRWLEKGESLLAQGSYAAARAEFERAVAVLPPESKAEVLRAVARTWFLEGDVERTRATLEEALALAPADEDGRQLYLALMRELGEEAAARRFLARLEEGSARAADEAPTTGVRVPSEAPSSSVPVLTPEAGRTGRYRVTFRVRSPLATMPELRRRMGLSPRAVREADAAEGAYEIGAETFDVFVPETYAPEAGFGLFVWISPTGSGGPRGGAEEEALLRHRLLWAGADRSGNPRPYWYRVNLALDAAHNLQQLYALDPERIYVGGYSGGGRVASALAHLYADVFRGGFFFFGCDYFRRVEVPDKPGAYWPARFPVPRQLKRLKREHRFVLLTGERDFNRAQTRATYERYLADGFRHVTLLEIPGASHSTLPGGEWLDRGFAALER